MGSILAAVAILLALAAIGFVGYGRERTWERLAGSPDPGRYDFAGAPRSKTPNDALACSPGLCAAADFVLPTYAMTPADLVAHASETLSRIDPLARRVDDGSDPAYARFVTFSPLMRFPDAIDIAAEALPGATEESGLKVYARARLGSSDLGKNRQRIEHLVANLKS